MQEVRIASPQRVLHPDALEKTVDALIEAMLDEVFGRA